MDRFLCPRLAAIAAQLHGGFALTILGRAGVLDLAGVACAGAVLFDSLLTSMFSGLHRVHHHHVHGHVAARQDCAR